MIILPKKQLSLQESLFGFGAFILKEIEKPISVDDLWSYYQNEYSKKKYAIKFSFDQFIITLDFLYLIGAIKKTDKELLCYEIN